MTDAPDYDAIEALRAKAEWGEWRVSTVGGVNIYASAFEEGYETHVADCTDDDPFDRKSIPNAELIVAAVNALPALIARCRELEAKVAGIRAAIDRADPPGRWRAGTPAVSVPALRSILDSTGDPTP